MFSIYSFHYQDYTLVGFTLRPRIYLESSIQVFYGVDNYYSTSLPGVWFFNSEDRRFPMVKSQTTRSDVREI